MNANELAEMIFHYWNETEGVEIPQTLLEDAATMLREQQRTLDGDKRLIALLYKKIEKLQSDNAELKAYNTELHGIEHDLEMKVMQQQAELDRLKKEWDYWYTLAIERGKLQEPNCYGDGNVYRGVRSKDSEVQTIHIGGFRELSDEEIDYCWTHSHGNTPWTKQKAFAMAILRKAQEK